MNWRSAIILKLTNNKSNDIQIHEAAEKEKSHKRKWGSEKYQTLEIIREWLHTVNNSKW